MTDFSRFAVTLFSSYMIHRLFEHTYILTSYLLESSDILLTFTKELTKDCK